MKTTMNSKARTGRTCWHCHQPMPDAVLLKRNRVCVVCNKIFTQTYLGWGGRAQVVCSDRCRNSRKQRNR